MAEYDFDLFTIGAGSGGTRAARIAAGHGARVAVAEERYLDQSEEDFQRYHARMIRERADGTTD